MGALTNKIYIGSLTAPMYYFENDNIFSVSVEQEVSLVGQELSMDTMTVTLADTHDSLININRFVTVNGENISCRGGQVFCIECDETEGVSDLINLPYGTPVWYYNEDNLVGKFYSDTVKRTGKNKYTLDCISSVGLLEKMYHDGGMFTSTTFSTVVADILSDGNGGTVIDYECGIDVADIPVSGWLPHDTKRNNLYQLLFAYGVNLIKNPNGMVFFTFIYPQASPKEITDDKIFATGNVSYDKSYSGVSVTEHTFTYLSTESAVTLFDNSNGERVANQQVWFTTVPVKASTVTASGNLTIVSVSENGAVVTGEGKLTGIPYVHTKRVSTKTNALAENEKTVDVTNCTMVNLSNSENLLNRLYAYYCPSENRETITNSIVCGTEKTGKAFTLSNPFNEEVTAYLTKMQITSSSFNKADCEFISGYIPAGQTGLYRHCMVLDASTYARDGGVFTVPPEVFQQTNPSIKVVIVGGGQGGQSGSPGENGKVAWGDFDLPTTYDIEWSEQRTDIRYDREEAQPDWYRPISEEIESYHGDDYVYPYHSKFNYKGGMQGGEGGKGGTGGNPGRAFVTTIYNPAQTYNYTIGVGGQGGAAVGFIPDTFSELKETLEIEEPNTTHTDAQINAIITQELASTNWRGTPNSGANGTSTTFGTFSSEGVGSYIPKGGVYDPINDKFYALKGESGVNGGAGGARWIDNGDGTSQYVSDGESVIYNGVTYEGGKAKAGTGQDPRMQRNLIENSLQRIVFHVDGGSGAGAAVGVSRTNNPEMDGDSTQTYSYSFENPEYLTIETE